MDKATMLYNKFKTMFLVGEGDSVLSQVLNKSLAEQRQHEEAKKGALKRVEQAKENISGTNIDLLISTYFTGVLKSKSQAVFNTLRMLVCVFQMAGLHT